MLKWIFLLVALLLCCVLAAEPLRGSPQSEPADPPPCIPSCAELNVTLLTRDELILAREAARQQKKDALRLRLDTHCAAQTAQTCKTVAALQQRLLESDSRVESTMRAKKAICVQKMLFELSIYSVYHSCKNSLTAALKPMHDTEFACFIETTYSSSKSLYDKSGTVRNDTLLTYFAVIDEPALPWWYTLWHDPCE